MKDLLLTILVLWLATTVSDAQHLNPVYDIDTLHYDEVKMFSIHPEDSLLSGYEGFDSLVKNGKYFFAGENHLFRKTNCMMKLNFLKYLHRKAGVNTLMMEFGYARGWMINRYINNEEDSTYKSILHLYSFDAYANLYDSLRAYNLRLPVDDRIIVKGIDIERFTRLPARVLSFLLPDKKASDSLDFYIKGIKGIASWLDNYYRTAGESRNESNTGSYFYFGYSNRKEYSVSKTLKTFLKSYDRFKADYQKFLGEKFQVFDKIVAELKVQQKYESFASTPYIYIFREQYLFNNFMDYIRQHPEAKTFGQFGRCHVAAGMQSNKNCHWFDFDALASKIKQEIDTGKTHSVVSIAYFYKSDQNYDYNTDRRPSMNKLLELAAKKGPFTAIEVTDDTLIFGKASSLYDYLIAITPEKKEVIQEAGFYSQDMYEYFDMTFQYNRYLINMGPVNRFLTGLGYPASADFVHSVDFGIGYLGNENIYISLTTGIFLPVVLDNSGDTSSLTLSGYNLMYYSGYSFLSSHRIFIVPRLGIGYNRMRMSYLQDSVKRVPQENIFGESRSESYINDAFMVDGSLKVILRFGSVAVSGSYGFMWDTSRGLWRDRTGNRMTTGPQLKLTGQYFTLGVDLLFGGN